MITKVTNQINNDNDNDNDNNKVYFIKFPSAIIDLIIELFFISPSFS